MFLHGPNCNAILQKGLETSSGINILMSPLDPAPSHRTCLNLLFPQSGICRFAEPSEIDTNKPDMHGLSPAQYIPGGGKRLYMVKIKVRVWLWSKKA